MCLWSLVVLVKTTLCMALMSERLELEAQGARYRLTRELRGLKGRVGEWIGEMCRTAGGQRVGRL
jgi:hypothetical protein